MPLYEGILTEKVSVVLDIGNAYTKCGFVGEANPRSIIRSELKDPKSGHVTVMRKYKNGDDLFRFLKSFLHHIFYKHLLVNPKERRIVIVESMLSPTTFRETVAKVLFKHFEVASVLFAPAHLMALYTLGISSGLVLDIGFSETLVIPIYQGVPILCAWESLPLAGQAIHSEIEKQMLETGVIKDGAADEKLLSSVTSSIPEKVIEDIKVQTCFVSPYDRASKMNSNKIEVREAFVPPKDVRYPFSKSTVLTIPGNIRENVAEVLFYQDNDLKSVSTLILDSLLKCSIDTRKELSENLIIMGGTALLPGFKSRLLAEVKNLLKENRYASKLAIQSLKVHNPPAKENNVAWLGASIFSDKEFLVLKSVVKKDYLEQGNLPDWCNLKYNVIDDSQNL